MPNGSKATYKPRALEDIIRQHWGREEIFVIKGPRQAGKTSLLLHLKDVYGGEYITMDDKDTRELFAKKPELFDSNPLFIDEIQRLPESGRILKALFDRRKAEGSKQKLVVSGSGAFSIKEKVLGHLVGRAIIFELFPLSFAEYVLWKDERLYNYYKEIRKALYAFIEKGNKLSGEPLEKLKVLYEEYLIFGGYPKVVLEERADRKALLLNNIVKLTIEEDVIDFFDINDKEALYDILTYLARSVSSLLEVSALPASFKTAKKYLQVLKEGYIIDMLKPFHKNVATELRKARKHYFIDNGFRNAILGNFLPLAKRENLGPLIENFVFSQLKQKYGENIRYWRTSHKAELDFVIEVHNKPIPLEVKSSPKVTPALHSFLSTYKIGRALVVGGDHIRMKKLKEGDVLFAPPYFL